MIHDSKDFNNLKIVFDNLINKNIDELNIKYVNEFEPTDKYQGIKAITYDGLNRGKYKTKNFAYIGFPKDISNKNIPAVVLIHGGGGYPFLQWVKEWNIRGYAAIAVSTVGLFPNRVNAGDIEGATDVDWKNFLHGPFKQEGYTATPYNDDMWIKDTQAPDEMWMYHAVSQVLLAGKVLETFDFIAKDKIGAIGISWGSIILSIALGYKNNFSYAIPIYGSGYLKDSLSFMRYKFILPRSQELWLAENNFKNIKIPVLWICMNDDICFSANSNSMSYLDTVNNNPRTTLSIKSGWIHGHSCCWDDKNYPCKEIYEFANAIVKKCDFPQISTFGFLSDGTLYAYYNYIKPENLSARLYYLNDDYEYTIPSNIHMSHPTHKWNKKLAKHIKKEKKISVKIPEKAKCCYLEIKDIEANVTISSQIIYDLHN